MGKLYVLGFVFDEQLDHILLVKKQRGPEFLHGLLNGVGGKVEAGESADEAMRRELREETLMDAELTYFGEIEHIVEGQANHIYLYAGTATPKEMDNVPLFNDVGEEQIWYVQRLLKNIVPNLKWLVPLARTAAQGYVVVARFDDPGKHTEKEKNKDV